MKWRTMLAAVAITAATLPALTYAQNNGGGGDMPPNNQGGNGGNGGGGGQNGGGGGGGRRGFDPAQMQQRMMDNIKDQLAASDDEWNVIEPKLQKVMDTQRDVRSGAMGGMRGMFGGGGGGRRGGGQNGGGGGGPGGPGGPPGGGPDPTTPVAIAAKELQTVLANKNATADDINGKLVSYRAARDKANTDLEASRKDLKDVLTAKQEAQLVLLGILE